MLLYKAGGIHRGKKEGLDRSKEKRKLFGCVVVDFKSQLLGSGKLGEWEMNPRQRVSTSILLNSLAQVACAYRIKASSGKCYYAVSR